MKWLAVVSGILSGVFLADMIAWLVSGVGLGELLSGGPSSPLVMAIASHLIAIPDWAFYLVCATSVVVLAVLMSLCIVSSLSSEKIYKKRRTA